MELETMTPKQLSALRLVMMIECLDFEKVTRQFQLKGAEKKRFNDFNSHLQNLRTVLTQGMGPAGKQYLDDNGALLWEWFDQFHMAKDKVEALAIAKCYNAGEMVIEQSKAA